jgi:hypothetical protein
VIIPYRLPQQAGPGFGMRGVDNFVKNFGFFKFLNALVFKISLKSGDEI